MTSHAAKLNEGIRYVAGIDIGGTSITAQYFPVKNGMISKEAVGSITQATVRGVEGHVSQMKAIIEEVNNRVAQTGGELVGIGIASPGRFNAEGNIKPGSNPNMGLNNINEFDGVNLGEEYRAALAGSPAATASIIVQNDANGMLSGMISFIADNKDRDLLKDQHGKEITKAGLYGKTVGLFGIGTGVGNSFVKFSAKGTPEFVTDGHVPKLVINVDPEDIPLLEQSDRELIKRGQKGHIIRLPGNRAGAEGLFSASAIMAMSGIESGRDIDMANPVHQRAVQFAGKYMARTIAVVKSGKSEDVVPENGWTAADKKAAAKASVYLIGGGIGSSNDVGPELIKYTQQELAKLGIKDMQLVRMPPTHAAEYGAATMVPEAVYQNARGR